MIKITAEIRALIDEATTGTKPAEDEYINPEDGLLYCKRCETPRQVVVPHPFGQGYSVHRCVCACRREAIEQSAAEEERIRRAQRIRRRKSQGLQDRYCLTTPSQMLILILPSSVKPLAMPNIGTEPFGRTLAYCFLVTLAPENHSPPGASQTHYWNGMYLYS